MKKNILVIGTLVLISILGYLGYNWYMEQIAPCCESPDTSDLITRDDFDFKYTYAGENLWNYSITGTFPNPCYTGSVEGLVRESYPEQVSIVLSVTPPEEDQVCAQMLQDYKYEGTFNASEEATVEFNVKNN